MASGDSIWQCLCVCVSVCLQPYLLNYPPQTPSVIYFWNPWVQTYTLLHSESSDQNGPVTGNTGGEVSRFAKFYWVKNILGILCSLNFLSMNIYIWQLRKHFPSSPLRHDLVPHLLTTKNASNQKMSENRPPLNIPTDSKTTFGIFKTQKSNSKMTP